MDLRAVLGVVGEGLDFGVRRFGLHFGQCECFTVSSKVWCLE